MTHRTHLLHPLYFELHMAWRRALSIDVLLNVVETEVLQKGASRWWWLWWWWFFNDGGGHDDDDDDLWGVLISLHAILFDSAGQTLRSAC